MNTLALDIGGANIKAAHSSGGAWSVPFALYRQPEKLGEMLGYAAIVLPPFDRVLVTMTAELCDCFETKRQGVDSVLSEVIRLAGKRPVRVWSTKGRFISPAEAVAESLTVAAANWHAQASMFAARFVDKNGLMIDTGSTTTDILRLGQGRVIPRGFTDTGRLESGELVYVGSRRTPLMSFGPYAQMGASRFGVMNELFADIADAHVLLGLLPEDATNVETWDRRPLTRPYAAARIARMIGADMEMLTMENVRDLAHYFATAARGRVVEGIRQVTAGSPVPDQVVVSGSGEFLAAAAAREAFGQAMPIQRMSETLGPQVSDCACAYALIQLDEKTV
jgi:probable H4MPT-linked C1 transfer pathway protein